MQSESLAGEPPPLAAVQREWQGAITALSLVLAAFHVYTAYAGPFYAIAQRAFHVGIATALEVIGPHGRHRSHPVDIPSATRK